MNERTREVALASIDEVTATHEGEEGRKLTVDQAVDQALELLSPP